MCGNWRQGDKDLPKVFLLESHKGGDRTLFPLFSFNALFSTLYSGTPVPPLSTGLQKVVNQMTYINANLCLPCFNTCRNFKCWDHTPPGGNLPKLQVPLGIVDLFSPWCSSVFIGSSFSFSFVGFSSFAYSVNISVSLCPWASSCTHFLWSWWNSSTLELQILFICWWPSSLHLQQESLSWAPARATIHNWTVWALLFHGR